MDFSRIVTFEMIAKMPRSLKSVFCMPLLGGFGESEDYGLAGHPDPDLGATAFAIAFILGTR